MIHGTVEPGFEDVRAVFERNFADRGEVGAACAVVHRGRMVVDLWGGLRDPVRRLPWERDTMAIVYSTTKGVVASALAVAASRGLLHFDEPVAKYWPEFGQQGKASITVRQLLEHQAGLPILDTPITCDRLGDLDAIAAALAAQRPLWEPGTRQGYHAVTWGWLTAELLRRVDPARRTLGRFVQEEVIGPLGLHFHIGTPPGEDARVAEVVEPGVRDLIAVLPHMPIALMAAAVNPRSLWSRAIRTIRVARVGEFNDPGMRRFEIPSTNGIGEPRALALLFGELAMGGVRLGISPTTFDAIRATPVAPPHGQRDAILKMEIAFNLGFIKPTPKFAFASASAFASAGTGGSFAFGDPERQLGFAYVPNRIGLYLRDDPRERALRIAALQCADAM